MRMDENEDVDGQAGRQIGNAIIISQEIFMHIQKVLWLFSFPFNISSLMFFFSTINILNG